MGLRNKFEKLAPLFEKGGKYEKYYALFEMVETFIYTPKTVTKYAPHARDYVDTKRIMTYVVLATIPAMLFGVWNIGYQTSLIANNGIVPEIEGMRGTILQAISYEYEVNSIFWNFVFGLLWFIPIYLTTLIVGGIVEIVFAVTRRHEVTEGFLVTSMLYSLIVPATTPLWQVGLGIAFGVIFGKEIFGGQGKNFMNPALVGRAFLYFAYPAYMTGDSIWIPVQGVSSATPLDIVSSQGMDALANYGIDIWTALIGFIPGSIGETSTIAIAMGLCFLLITKIANWRLVAGCLAGTIATVSLLNYIGSETNLAFEMPWYWHIAIGGYAFGLAFMVTEPVSAASTNRGRLIYGFLIGFMVVLIRVINPAFPEGMMLAILFGNIFAPTIDYFVMQSNIKKRKKRNTKILNLK